MDDSLFSNAIERAHWATIERSTQESRGQFWTPYPVARLMAAWLASTVGDIVDPAAGTGVFLRALADPARPIAAGRRVFNQDIDRDMLAVIRDFAAKIEDVEAVTLEGNGLDLLAERPWPGVIMNPPYIRHHDLADKEETVAALDAATGLRFSRLLNLYAIFLVRGALSLSAGGRLAAIVPSEFLNANYGRAVKRFLLDRGLLRAILAFDFTTSVFDNATTTACVVFLERGERPPSVSFRSVASSDELATIERALAGGAKSIPGGIDRPVGALDPNAKWRVYFEATDHRDTGMIEIGSIARATRGIASGHNGFFLKRRSEIEAEGLDMDWFVPAIGRSEHVARGTFTVSDFDRLDVADRPVWLLRVPPDINPLPDALRRLFATPEAIEASGRYLCRTRSPWWDIERRPVAPLWVGVFSRGSMKIVRNLTAAVTLQAFHIILPRADADPETGALLSAYFRTDLFVLEFARQRREYGHGLVKVEPKDIEAILVPHFAAMTALERATILEAERRIADGTSDLEHKDIALIEAVLADFREEARAA